MPLAIFDLDGTLVDQESAARVWAQGFVEKWSLRVEDHDVVSAALIARRPKDQVFGELVRYFDIPVSPSAVWDDYRAQMPALVPCTDADREALQKLRSEGWKLGIVTNGMADNQVGKIRSTGLSDLVDGWVVSSEIGARKPDPAIFHALAQRVGYALEGWMIGDSLEMDIAGGAGVGLKTAWITATPSAEATPTITARTVADAIRLILDR